MVSTGLTVIFLVGSVSGRIGRHIRRSTLTPAVCGCSVSCTHLDLDTLGVDDFYDAHNIIKHQACFLTVV